MIERLFLALEVNADVRNAALAVQTALRERFADRMRAMDLSGLHVTLQFLGDVEALRKSILIETIRSLSLPRPFELKLDGVGVFPSQAAAEAVYLKIKPSHLLDQLRAPLVEATEVMGFEDVRAFVPHITIARFATATPVVLEAYRANGSFDVARVVLMNSIPEGRAHRYEVVKAFAL